MGWFCIGASLGIFFGFWLGSLEQKRRAFLREVRQLENWQDPNKTPLKSKNTWYGRIIARTRPRS